MKSKLLRFIALVIYLQLLAGNMMAAIFVHPSHHLSSNSSKHANLSEKAEGFSYIMQLLMQEEDEDDVSKPIVKTLPATAVLIKQHNYLPVVSAENKHFLIHYASSIKGEFTHLYIMHNLFLI